MSLPPEELEAGTSAHYLSAEYYDRVYRHYEHDIPFYMQVALEHGSPVLELGCGTGRITIPMARVGARVVGVDVHPTMLAAARERLEREEAEVRGRVELVGGDLREVDLGARFRLVAAPFNVLQHFYTREDLESFFAAVRRHLRPRVGRFVFDVLVPDPEALARDPERRYKLGKAWHPAGRKRYLYRESFAYDAATQVQTITMHFEDPHDPAGSFSTPLCHRQLFPAELEALLHYNGFGVLERYGAFDRSPLEEVSETQVYVCALAQGRR